MHPVEAMHGDLGMLSATDLLIALSYSGGSEELLAVLPSAKRLGVPVAAITGAPDSELARWSDLVVPAAVPREACPFNLAPTTSTTVMVALGDALAIVLLESRRFGREDYHRLHPAGAIGRSITLTVTDVMRTGDAFPTVGPDAKVREAVGAMTRARCGSVAVTTDSGRLLGIFTDGDLRRHLTEDSAIMDARIASVMTPDPVTVRDDAMAVELVRTLETHKIDDILVVDCDNRAVGLVDIQDLPRFKVM
jgi:arabinose-5-phosphate isomerase